jgi:protein SCO1/2
MVSDPIDAAKLGDQRARRDPAVNLPRRQSRCQKLRPGDNAVRTGRHPVQLLRHRPALTTHTVVKSGSLTDSPPSSLSRVNPRVLIALFLVAAFSIGAIALAASGRNGDGGDAAGAATRFEGAVMPAGLRAPDFSLRNQDGEVVSMRELRGQPVIVTFLYTTCEETCPAQAQTSRGALDELGEDVPALAIAVDPPRDTPERARAFLSEQRALGRIDFVLGDRAELRPLWKGFAIRPQSVTEEHQARFTLVDKRGFQRVGYPGFQATPERLAHDLRILQAEG